MPAIKLSSWASILVAVASDPEVGMAVAADTEAGRLRAAGHIVVAVERNLVAVADMVGLEVA